MPGPDYILDITGLALSGDKNKSESTRQEVSGLSPRPWIAVTWKCCSVYSRIYRNRAGTAYEGRCPKCAKLVKAKVGPGGTDRRFFEAG